VENRVRAAEEGKCSFEEKAGRLTVTYRAVRHDIEERVQALSRETTLDVLVAIMRRATTQRRTESAGFHLIQPREQASRSHTVFWNSVRHFGSAHAAASAAKNIISAPPPQEQ
jgi:hypothetical protein